MKRLKLNGKFNGKKIRKLVADDPVALDQARAVWQLRIEGMEPFDIAIKLNLPTHRVKKILEVCMEEFTADIQSAVAQERALDISRNNQLIATYLPIAQDTEIKDWKRPVQAAEIVIRCIEMRSKLFGYDEADVPKTLISNSNFFLAGEALKSVDMLVDSQPKELPEFSEDVLDMTF